MPTEATSPAAIIRGVALRITWTLTLGVYVAFLAGSAGQRWWPLGLLSHFRLQYALAAATSLAIFLIFRSRAGALASGLLLAVNLGSLLLYYAGGPATATASGPALRVLYANVNTKNPDHQPLLELIERESPDIIALAEVHDDWVESLSVLRDRYPHQVIRPRIDNFGIGLWSRHPLALGEVRSWGDANVPSIEARFLHQDQPITMLFTHPLPPMRRRLTALRDGQLTTLAGIAKARGPRTVLLGDFNTTPFHAIFDEVLATSDLRDASRSFGPQPTWPARLPWVLRIPIDHCLHSADLEITRLQTGPRIGSDHLPLIVELR